MANVENETIQEETNSTENSDQDKKLANLVNSAVSSHIKRQMSKFNESIESILSEKLGSLQSTSTPEKKEKSLKEESEVAKLRAELAAEKRAALEKDTYSGLKEKLTGKVRPEAVGSVIKILKADGHIDFSKKDGPVFKFDGEEYSLEDGIETWLENAEDAKLFKPAPSPSAKKSPFKAPQRKGTGADSAKQDPKQATMAQLQKLGLRL